MSQTEAIENSMWLLAPHFPDSHKDAEYGGGSHLQVPLPATSLHAQEYSLLNVLLIPWYQCMGSYWFYMFAWAWFLLLFSKERSTSFLNP